MHDLKRLYIYENIVVLEKKPIDILKNNFFIEEYEDQYFQKVCDKIERTISDIYYKDFKKFMEGYIEQTERKEVMYEKK